jgi:hypothetical protein
MRWQRLFQDLEDQLERETDAELEDIARDEERLRIARLTLAQRLRSLVTPSESAPNGARTPRLLSIRIGDRDVECSVSRVGRDWMLVEVASPNLFAGSALIPLGAVSSIRLTGVASDPRSLGLVDGDAPSTLASDIGLAFVLRDLARRRRHLRIVSVGSEVSGLIDRVGRDHIDVSVHGAGLGRAESRALTVFLIPQANIQMVLLP